MCCEDATPPGTVIDVDTQSAGQLIKQARMNKGLTQEGLAELVGVSQRAVSDIERGIIKGRRFGVLERYADALGIRLADLYGAVGRGETQEEAEEIAEIMRSRNDPLNRALDIANAAKRIDWTKPGRYATIDTIFRLYRTEDATGERQEGARIWDGPTETIITQRERTS